ncbi:KAP family P-loop domain protein [Scytonema sp. NUACC21]
MAGIEGKLSVATEHSNILSADNPLTDPKDDRLGYAPFAKNLADSICKMSPPEGFVMAVYAPWGSGKSTLLNFIVHNLEQKPENEQPIIVRFNPWWFSGEEDISRRFFEQLLAVLTKKRRFFREGLIKQIDSLAERVSTIPDRNAKIFATVVKTIRQPKDVYKLKEEVETTLKNQQKRILVVIDDIDRLTVEEVRQLFRVIKAVANFSNTIYLLLFDKEVVIKALAESQKISGEAYLEKIVQVPFELPLPDQVALRRLFREQLDVILVDTPEELFKPSYWNEVYFNGIEHFITTPRNIVRLINTLKVTYPVVKGEVNPVDFIAIETLKVFCPFVYNIIQKNLEVFTGHMSDFTLLSYMSNDEQKNFHTDWINQVNEKDRKSVKIILKSIFPNLQNAFGNQGVFIGSQELEKRRKHLRICSEDIFPVYFRLAIPEGNISYAEMKVALTLANDSKKFADKLLELSNQIRFDGTTKVQIFLERLKDYANEDIVLNFLPSILEVFFEIGDKLLKFEDERNAFFNMGNEFTIEYLINQFLERVEKPERSKILRDAMLKGHAITTIVWQVISLGEQHGKYEAIRHKPEEERLVNVQQLEELEKLALEKVREAAQQDSLLRVPKLRIVLSFWRDSGSKQEAREWVQKIIQKDENLIHLLENFLVIESSYRLDPQWYASYLEPSEIIIRVRILADKSGLTKNQKIALKQFIKEYDKR